MQLALWTGLSAALGVFLATLFPVAFYVLAERKVLGSLQRRRGPSAVGFWGLLQPIADGVKLVIKESIRLSSVGHAVFGAAPLGLLAVSFAAWAFMPLGWNVVLVDSNISLLLLLGFSSISVYGVLLAGWASHSRYALIGGLRAVAQLISYELALTLIILPIIFLASSGNLLEIVQLQARSGWLLFPLLPLFMLFFTVALAETNRTPFDLPEAEAELVAGFNVEYSATTFAMFFLAEYSSMLVMCILGTVLFLGGWLGGTLVFTIKVMVWAFFYIAVRGALPRYRHDQLMTLGWKNLLVFTFGYFLFILLAGSGLGTLPAPSAAVWLRSSAISRAGFGLFEA